MSVDSWSKRFAGWLHARLFVCYPEPFRARFGAEARDIFDRRLVEARGRGRAAFALSLLLALADVVRSGFQERSHARGVRAAHTSGRPHMIWDTLRGDLRLGFRLLWRAPVPTLLSVLALAMGIGASSAMFSVVDGVILRPLPYADPDALVRIRGGQSYPDLQDWTKELTRFDGFGGFRPQSFDRQTPDGTERLPGALVTGGLFDVLGTLPQLGRLITAADDRPGGEHVVVVSHGFWKRALAGRADAVGQHLQVIDGTYRIIGVLPQDFELWLTPADVIAPIAAESIEVGFRGVHSLAAVGRVADGVSLEVAQAEIDALASRLEQRYPQQNRGRVFPLQPLQSSLVAGIQSTMVLLAGAVALVWVIACVNVTNLQLSRALGRRSEMATRRAVGATRFQLLRQLVVEQLMLAGAAGLAGVAVAYWLISLIRALSLEDVPRLDTVTIDGRALLFAAVTSLTTAVVFGVVPAVTATKTSAGLAIGHGARVSRGRRRMVAVLLVGEIAATAVLMIGGGLLLNSYARLIHVNPGFDPDRILTFNLTLRPLPRTPPAASPIEARRRAADLIEARTIYYEQIIDAVRAIPGVRSVAASTDLPIAEGAQNHDLTFEGRAVDPGTEPSVYYRGVNPGFFAAFGLRLIRGREFTPADRLTQPHVAIVNEAFARQHFPGVDPDRQARALDVRGPQRLDHHRRRGRRLEGPWPRRRGSAGGVWTVHAGRRHVAPVHGFRDPHQRRSRGTGSRGPASGRLRRCHGTGHAAPHDERHHRGIGYRSPARVAGPQRLRDDRARAGRRGPVRHDGVRRAVPDAGARRAPRARIDAGGRRAAGPSPGVVVHRDRSGHRGGCRVCQRQPRAKPAVPDRPNGRVDLRRRALGHQLRWHLGLRSCRRHARHGSIR